MCAECLGLAVVCATRIVTLQLSTQRSKKGEKDLQLGAQEGIVVRSYQAG